MARAHAHRTATFDDADSCSQPASADMVYQGIVDRGIVGQPPHG
jgi:hypothetical protein